MSKYFKQTLNTYFLFFRPRLSTKLRLPLFAFVCGMVCATGITGKVWADSSVYADIPDYEYPYTEQQTLDFIHSDPVVVELFTSVNCVYCPNADRLLKDLAAKTNIIALSCHVDYYDTSDTPLSKNICSKRQFEYSKHIPGSSVFTPQMVMNGSHSAIGYKTGSLLETVRKARATAPARIEIVHSPEKTQKTSSFENETNSGVQIHLPDLSAHTESQNTPDLTLWMAEYEKEMSVNLPYKTGNNAKFTYANVITGKSVIEWDGQQTSLEIGLPEKRDGQGLAIFAQKGNGRILAAGTFEWAAGDELN